MTDLIALISRHGYAVVAAIVFAEAIGLPVPAAIALVAAGAAVAGQVLRAPIVLPLAIAAMVVGDALLFLAGRYPDGLCWVSCVRSRPILRPAFCARRSRSINAARLRW